METIHCFGVGLVGSYVVRRLAAKGHLIHAYDLDPSVVDNVENVVAHKISSDFPKDQFFAGISGSLVLNMLPGSIGSEWTRAMCGHRMKIIDLSFSEVTPDVSASEAAQHGSRVLWDVGIAPGLSNMFAIQGQRSLGPLESLKIWVGGNPVHPEGKWSYMAPFSPTDVIEEYTRPARVMIEGREVIIPALSDRHEISVPGHGEMEAFLTDGLRSLTTSIPCSEMAEYTVRWPGHIQCYLEHIESGQLDRARLIEEWKYDPGTPEFTWLKVKAQNRLGQSVEWVLEDNGGKDGHSMARTTGLVTAICAEMILEDEDLVPLGVHPPEVLPDHAISRIVSEMRDSGVSIDGPTFN